MSDRALRFARAADALVGSPFCLYGRDPASGLDCIGVVLVALRVVGVHIVEQPYRLRNADIGEWLALATSVGLSLADEPGHAGDILLVAPGPAQHHLLVVGETGDLIHAHAGLRRVVRMPGPSHWPVTRRWRLPPSREYETERP